MAYNAKYMHGMGITLVVLGSIGIILGIAADVAFGVMGAYTPFHYVSAPIWSGIFVVILGILGICSGRNPASKGLIVALLVLGIITILNTISCFSLAIVGALVDGDYCHFGPYGYDDCTAAAIALHGVNALLAFAEIVMGFVASIMSCCGLSTPNTYIAAPPGQGAYVIMPAGVQYPTVNVAGGIPQQQVFVTQQQYPTAVPI